MAVELPKKSKEKFVKCLSNAVMSKIVNVSIL